MHICEGVTLDFLIKIGRNSTIRHHHLRGIDNVRGFISLRYVISTVCYFRADEALILLCAYKQLTNQMLDWFRSTNDFPS